MSGRAIVAALSLALLACAGDPAREPQAAAQPERAPAAPSASETAPTAAAASTAEQARPQRGPQEVADPASVGVGLALPLSLEWTAVPSAPGEAPRSGTLAGLLEGAPAAVVVLTSLHCPLTRLYAPLLRERLDPWRARGVRVVVLDPLPQDEPADLHALAARLEWDWPVIHDPSGRWQQALRAERTTDTFLIDARGLLRYRGALDDQYGIGYRLPAPRRALLADALEAVLAGRAPAVAATQAPGCLLPAGLSTGQ